MSESNPHDPFHVLPYEEARALARTTNRVVLLNTHERGSKTSDRFLRSTWKNATVLDWLVENTVAVRMDSGDASFLARELGLGSFPCLAFVDPDGTRRGLVLGHLDSGEFLQEVESLLESRAVEGRLPEELEATSIDPSIRLYQARALAWAGRFAEALDGYLWCFDHGMEHSNGSFFGVRRSFLLGYLSRLASVHEPAMEAMRERRDRARENVLHPPAQPDTEGDAAGEADDLYIGFDPVVEAAWDFESINVSLEDEALTLELYDDLEANEPLREGESWVGGARELETPRAALFKSIFPLLVKAKRYSEVVAGFDYPPRWFRESTGHHFTARAMMDGYYAKGSEPDVAALPDGSLELYEAMVGTGRHDALAARYVDAVIEYEPGLRSWQALMGSARRAGRRDTQLSLREAAVRALPSEDHPELPDVED